MEGLSEKAANNLKSGFEKREIHPISTLSEGFKSESLKSRKRPQPKEEMDYERTTKSVK